MLRQRPGHYYWQAYLTGDAANGAEEPIGPVQELTVTAADGRPRPRQALPALRPAHGTGKSFYLSSADFPGTVDGARFKKIAKRPASRWGLKALRWTSAKAGVQDGFNVAGFSSDVAAGVLGVQTDYVKRGKVVESDLALRAERELGAGPGLPGARRGRPRERRCCTSSATWPATRSTARAAPTRR